MARRNADFMSSGYRLVLCAALGIATAVLFISAHLTRYAALAGWDIAAVVYILLVFSTVLRFDQATTKSHAVRENPGRVVSDALLLAASLASLFAVGLLVVQSANSAGLERTIAIAVGLVSVVVSWAVVHTTFVLNYARQYYGEPEGGIDFGKQKPTYLDFVYLAFTIGMTFQTSDTPLQTSLLRSTVLKHALLSYVFGTAVIAATINFLVGLGK
ncbi:MAG TPA: DUF1345 domain-containing protein [Candidatus Saccharimonadales bacterium]|nr:DUF1345 domain-containing protein [Candidatus Saccharimonadales bacterium]